MSGKVVIVGSGTVGSNWALLFARGGFDVVLVDERPEAPAAAIDGIRNNQIPLLQNYDFMFGNSPDDILSRLSTCPKENLQEAVQNAIFVQTAVFEDVGVKSKVLGEVDEALRAAGNPECVISSSSSGIAPSAMFDQIVRKDYFLVSHPVNPPIAIPIVEIVRSPQTRDDAVQRTVDLMTQIGMKPVQLQKEANGFIINRLQYALLHEAYRLVADGVASPEDIDTCLKHGLGRRWAFLGPFETIDLNAPRGVNDYCERYTDGMHRVLDEQDNSVRWTPDVWEKIDAAMRDKYPREAIPEQTAERNTKLFEIEQLHQRWNNRSNS